jgi:hypothetical protein
MTSKKHNDFDRYLQVVVLVLRESFVRSEQPSILCTTKEERDKGRTVTLRTIDPSNGGSSSLSSRIISHITTTVCQQPLKEQCTRSPQDNILNRNHVSGAIFPTKNAATYAGSISVDDSFQHSLLLVAPPLAETRRWL